MQNKFKLNIVVSVIIIALVFTAVWYFTRSKVETNTNVGNISEEEKTNEVATIEEGKWYTPNNIPEQYKTVLPKIETIAESALPYPAETGFDFKNITISPQDFNGDGELDLLIDMGVGGASTTLLVIELMKDGIPEPAWVEEPNGEVHIFNFESGAAVTHSVGFKVDKEKNTVSTMSMSINISDEADKSTIESCEVNSYLWSEGENRFIYNKNFSDSYKTKYCVLTSFY